MPEFSKINITLAGILKKSTSLSPEFSKSQHHFGRNSQKINLTLAGILKSLWGVFAFPVLSPPPSAPRLPTSPPLSKGRQFRLEAMGFRVRAVIQALSPGPKAALSERRFSDENKERIQGTRGGFPCFSDLVFWLFLCFFLCLFVCLLACLFVSLLCFALLCFAFHSFLFCASGFVYHKVWFCPFLSLQGCSEWLVSIQGAGHSSSPPVFLSQVQGAGVCVGVERESLAERPPASFFFPPAGQEMGTGRMFWNRLLEPVSPKSLRP